MKSRKRRKRSYGFRLLFAVLFFSCSASFCVAARYVLTRSITFGFDASAARARYGIDLSDDYVADGLIWSGASQEKELEASLGADGYTLSFLATGEEGLLLSTRPDGITSQLISGVLEHKTGYVDAEGNEIWIRIPCGEREDDSVPMEISIVADPSKQKILSYVDNKLVQVFILEEGAVFAGTDILSLKSERVHAMRLYNRPLIQKDLTWNYYLDLMMYGVYEDTELPAFLQKNSLLRVYAGSWEDQGRYRMSKEIMGEIRVEDNSYQGLLVATASDATPSDASYSDAVIRYEGSQPASEIDYAKGFTARYVLRMSDLGVVDRLFTASGTEESMLSGGYSGREFRFRAFGNLYSVDCGDKQGRISVVVTASELGIRVFVDGESREPVLVSEDQMSVTYDSFEIRLEGGGEQSGALYQVELYDRVLSSIEQNYLYQRDVARHGLDTQSLIEYRKMDLGDAPVYKGDWQLFDLNGDRPEYTDEDGYEFSHWFCKEYQTSFLDEDFEMIREAALSDGYDTLQVRPVYVAYVCQIYLHHADGTVMEQRTVYSGTRIFGLPDGSRFGDGEGFKGWVLGDGTEPDWNEWRIAEDAFLYPRFEDAAEGTESMPEIVPEGQPESNPETNPESQPESQPETQPESRPEPSPGTQPETSPENKPETSPETSPESRPETQPETLPETQPAAPPETQPAPKPETSPESTLPPESSAEASGSAGDSAASPVSQERAEETAEME